MLSFSFASPYLIDKTLDPGADPVEVTHRIQQARKSMHARNRSYTVPAAGSAMHQQQGIMPDSVKPSMLARRASLESHLLAGSSEIPDAVRPQHEKKLSDGALAQLKVLGEVDTPYDLNITQESDDGTIKLSTTMVRSHRCARCKAASLSQACVSSASSC
jgi:hypothetical protein